MQSDDSIRNKQVTNTLMQAVHHTRSASYIIKIWGKWALALTFLLALAGESLPLQDALLDSSG